MARRDVVVLGSTGSIGTQALEIVRRNPDRFRVVGLTAGGSRPDLFEQQVAEFAPAFHGAGGGRLGRGGGDGLRRRAQRHQRRPGPAAHGRRPRGGHHAGAGQQGVADHRRPGGDRHRASPGQIVAVDSEHSALAQCLRGGRADEVRRLVLTASGGPFRGRSRGELREVTPARRAEPPHLVDGAPGHGQLRHPGQQGARGDRGPPALRHRFRPHRGRRPPHLGGALDGRVRRRLHAAAGLAPVDAHPDRAGAGLARPGPGAAAPVDWTSPEVWEFTPLDDEAFPAVRLAREAGAAGGVMPAVYNAANEVCVARFLDGRLRFTDIVPTIERVLRDPGVPSDEELTVDAGAARRRLGA